jgi:hypothetical protein
MGRNKLIETPQKLWDLFESYREYVINNPRTIDKALQSGKVVKETLRVPLTMEGFELFCIKEGSDSHHYFDNTENRYSEYGTICRTIKKAIRQDQIEGGMVGQYNPSITQRLNNLTEKTDVTTNGEAINEIKISIIRPDTKQLD